MHGRFHGLLFFLEGFITYAGFKSLFDIAKLMNAADMEGYISGNLLAGNGFVKNALCIIYIIHLAILSRDYKRIADWCVFKSRKHLLNCILTKAATIAADLVVIINVMISTAVLMSGITGMIPYAALLLIIFKYNAGLLIEYVIISGAAVLIFCLEK